MGDPAATREREYRELVRQAFRELIDEHARGEVLIPLPPDVRECLEKHLDNWIKLTGNGGTVAIEASAEAVLAATEALARPSRWQCA